MLTEKQKKEIAEAAENGFRTYTFPYPTVVAAIDAYDKIKDVEDVKTASIITGINFSGILKEGGILKEAEEAEAAVKAASNSKTEEMLLDEAIKHYLDKALDDVSFTCKRDHLRVASWLSELRVRRSRND